jgi:site-specific recombinase XerD
MDTVEEWLELRTEHGYPDATDNPTIFCRRDGTYYTDDQIRSYYARASEKGKVGSKVTPHMIRHFFNDTLRKQGVPSEVREAILGHADAETNKGYTAPRAEEGLEAIEKLGSLVAG